MGNKIFLCRIQEYKRDFEIYSYSCFNAFNRLKKIEEKRSNRIKAMNVISLILSILGISAFITQVIDGLSREWSLFMATMLGLISIILNLLSLLHQYQEQSKEYFLRAEWVNVLWKKARNIEFLIQSEKISEEDIMKSIEYFQGEAEKYALKPLYITAEDYQMAREQLDKGQKSYTREELIN